MTGQIVQRDIIDSLGQPMRYFDILIWDREKGEWDWVNSVKTKTEAKAFCKWKGVRVDA